MVTIGKILVPIDVNTDTSCQINSAIELAQAYKAGIILMYVIPVLKLKKEVKCIVEKSVNESLDEIKNSFENNNVIVQKTLVVYGNIVETILKTINSEDVNLVLIGENKEHKRVKFKLSGKSEQIIRASNVPVCLIRETKKTILNNILCPVDFSDPSKRALFDAISLAKTFNATLYILNVFEPIVYLSSRISIDLNEENKLRLERTQDEMQEFIKNFNLNAVDYEIEIISGKAHEKILNTIKEKDIDLLVMGTNGRTGLSSFIMGNITEKVIREMPCSFLTVKEISAIGVNNVTFN